MVIKKKSVDPKNVVRYVQSKLEFARYADGVAQAAKRAETLAEPGREHLTNPASGVWALVRSFNQES